MTKNKNEITAIMPGDSIENVRKLIASSAETLLEGANMLYRLYQADKTVVEKLTEGPTGFPDGFINGLLRVGEKSLHPTLLLNRCPAYRRLSLLSYSAQESALKNGKVELVVDAETGNSVLVDLPKLEGEQISQVISHAGLRSKDEQRAWLKRRATAPKIPKTIGPPYVVKKDRIHVLRGDFELTRMDMLRLLEQFAA